MKPSPSPCAIAVLVAGALLAGCQGGGGDDAPAPISQVTIANTARPSALDPGVVADEAPFAIIDQMFVGLTRYDKRTGELTDDLARSATASADGLTWTFKLREARWSNGDPITAGDVEFGIKRALDPATGGQLVYSLFVIEGAADYNAGTGPRDGVGVRAIDDATVEIRLDQPIAFLRGVLAMPASRPVPRAIVEQLGPAWLDPANIAVSGAYKLERIEGNSDVIVLERNPRYSGEPAQIARVTFRTLDDEDFPARRARYASGELDYAPASILEGVPAVRADPGLAADLFVGIQPTTVVMIFNTAAGPTTITAVRQALSAAANRREMAFAARGSRALATRSWAPPSVFGGVDPSRRIGIRYDEGAALSYAALAGKDFPTSITITVITEVDDLNRAAQAAKVDMERIFRKLGRGFDVTIEAVPFVVEAERLVAPDASAQAAITLIAWLADYPDANDFHVDGVQSMVRSTSTTFTAIAQQAARALDPEVRKALYRDAEKALCETDCSLAPIFNDIDAFLARPRLKVFGDRVERWTISR